MRRRWLAAAASVLILAATALGLIIAIRSHSNRETPSQETTTVISVERRDLVFRQTYGGAVGYADPRALVNRLSGTVTAVPAEGTIAGRGSVLYRIDTRPVVLLFGAVPAWRSLRPGIEPGSDIAQLQRNLGALGFRRQAVTGAFDASTASAISEWQRSLGVPASGTVPLGTVVFLPGRRRVGAVRVFIGSPAAAGATVMTTSALAREVTVRLPATQQQLAHAGESVGVTLPTGRAIRGRIADVGKVATARPGEAPAITIRVSVEGSAVSALDQAPVTVSVEAERKHDALSVPVEALLALRGGGYALEVVSANRATRLVRVSLGMSADGYIEVAGAGIVAGLHVTAAE